MRAAEGSLPAALPCRDFMQPDTPDACTEKASAVARGEKSTMRRRLENDLRHIGVEPAQTALVVPNLRYPYHSPVGQELQGIEFVGVGDRRQHLAGVYLGQGTFPLRPDGDARSVVV